MSEEYKEETTPDELMESFQGRSLSSIVVFTIVIHAALILGTSIPFLTKSVFGEDTSEMTEEDKVKAAVKEASESIKEIAKAHGMTPQDLSAKFSGPSRPSAPKPVDKPTPATPASSNPDADPEDPKSSIEKELDVKADGPEKPKIGEEEEDLFK